MENNQTKISFERLRIKAADLGEPSSLPDFEGTILSHKFVAEKEIEEKLTLNYATVYNSFPYFLQDNYNRTLTEKEIPSVILENRYLRAEFLPSHGGRLWSLFDKVGKRELLFKNTVLRYGNLATRHAWFAGGVEWNCGITGHSPYTCSTVYSEYLYSDGVPVFRIYEYERVRKIVYQIDFSLPANSRFLRCRVRIENSGEETPMYWWSNIAVRTDKDVRIVVPADGAFSNRPKGEDFEVYRESAPINDGIDVTYPKNTTIAKDYFWDIPTNQRKYICTLDSEGKGLMQFSTSKQIGRKLFVWGNSRGGNKWQRLLSGCGDAGKYCEIQAGLAKTQYENVKMPADTVWEWLEFYGAWEVSPDKACGEYAALRKEVEKELEKAMPNSKAEVLLEEGKKYSLTAGQTITLGSGFGALENERRKSVGQTPVSKHLQFVGRVEDNECWLSLLHCGTVGERAPCDIPSSYMRQSEWLVMLREAITGKDEKNWYAYYLLATAAFADRQVEKAIALAKKSYALTPSGWAAILLAAAYDRIKDASQANEWSVAAYTQLPNTISIIKRALIILCRNGGYREVVALYEGLPKQTQKLSRVTLCAIQAFLETGALEKAKELLIDKKVDESDLKEGETTLTELYIRYKELTEGTRDLTVLDSRIPDKYIYALL